MPSEEDGHRARMSGMRALFVALAVLLITAGLSRAAYDPQLTTALHVADLLRDARTVISMHQERINNPDLGDKGLSGDAVVAQAMAMAKKSGVDLGAVDPKSNEGRLVGAMAQAIRQVMAANQEVINQRGVGFKGFVPAVFGRLVTEQFRKDVGGVANIKVTAPPHLVRNRKASPDAFERRIIHDKFSSATWSRGQLYSTSTTVNGRPALRVLVPEYYTAGCLACHGQPKGQIDITGYPKEGAKLGDLGGVISITLFR